MSARGFGWRQVLQPGPALLNDRNISALAADDSGRLWVGYFDRGLDLLEADGKRSTHVENEHVFCVNRIWPDMKTGTVAVATANGLIRFGASGRQEQVLTRSDGLIADHVTDVVAYRDGLAIATPAGLTFLDSNGARSMYTFQGLVNNHVYALGVSGDELKGGDVGRVVGDWGGREPPSPESPAAVAALATRGLVIIFEEKPVAAMFTRSCGGHTRTPMELGISVNGYPYYSVVCDPCYKSPMRWTRRISEQDAALLLGKGEAGRLAVDRRLGWNTVSSNNFTVRKEDGEFVLEGIGEGHGIGLCQRGAKAMAEGGANFHEIIGHYFPNTAVSSANTSAAFESIPVN